MLVEQDSSGGFVWPPRVLGEPEESESAAAPRLGMLDVLETQLLGRVGLAFRACARIEGWAPDAAGAYCQRCGGSVGPYESDGEGCPACRTKRLPWERAIRLGAYTGPIRQAVLDLKFHGWRQTGKELGRALGVRVGEALDRAQIERTEAAIVPVPTHWQRRLGRGVDHTLILARACGQAARVHVRQVLTRVGGASQLEVPSSQRVRNVAGVFRRRRRGSLEGVRVVILLDDVRTTGATLRAASRALVSGGDVQRLWVATAGVTNARGRRETAFLGEGGGGRAHSVSIVSENVD